MKLQIEIRCPQLHVMNITFTKKISNKASFVKGTLKNLAPNFFGPIKEHWKPNFDRNGWKKISIYNMKLRTLSLCPQFHTADVLNMKFLIFDSFFVYHFFKRDIFLKFQVEKSQKMMVLILNIFFFFKLKK